MKALIAVLATVLLTFHVAFADEAVVPGPIIGIGTELKTVDSHPVVASVLPNGPAEKSGIKPGDRILSIDGKSVDGLALQQVANLLHGAASSRVHLLVQRGDVKKSFSLRRQILLLPGSPAPSQP
jgi:C-terminal processing protease CtpA/Prc